MDETTEQRLRAMEAQLHSISFFTEFLLRQSFAGFSRPEREQLAESIIQAATDTSRLSGLAKGDEARAEYLADTGIRSHEAVKRLVAKTLRAVAEMEDRANAQAADEV